MANVASFSLTPNHCIQRNFGYTIVYLKHTNIVYYDVQRQYRTTTWIWVWCSNIINHIFVTWLPTYVQSVSVHQCCQYLLGCSQVERVYKVNVANLFKTITSTSGVYLWIFIKHTLVLKHTSLIDTDCINLGSSKNLTLWFCARNCLSFPPWSLLPTSHPIILSSPPPHLRQLLLSGAGPIWTVGYSGCFGEVRR